MPSTHICQARIFGVSMLHGAVCCLTALTTKLRTASQVRSQAIEAQLASTVAELCNLRARQQQLESRNLLLEKCSHLSSKQNEEQLNGVIIAKLQFYCDF